MATNPPGYMKRYFAARRAARIASDCCVLCNKPFTQPHTYRACTQCRLTNNKSRRKA
jgi:hypothetical protein